MPRLETAHLQYLARGWSALRLAVESPDRFPSWDAVILTAASDAQARLYERRMEEARDCGILPERTLTIAAPEHDAGELDQGFCRTLGTNGTPQAGFGLR